MAKGLPESFLPLDDSGTLSSKQRQRKCFTAYYSKYYCKAGGRHMLGHDKHAVTLTDCQWGRCSLCRFSFFCASKTCLTFQLEN